MNRVFLSGISAIAGGAIVHVTDKESMNQLKEKNDEYKRLVKRLIDELNRKNRKIRELEKKVNKEKEEAAGFQQTRQRELFKELDEILNRLDGINENLMDLFKGQELIKKQLDKIERTTRRRNGYI